MKSTVMSRTSTIVAVAVGCGLWVVALPARSVEGIREERGLGATIIYVTHRSDQGMYWLVEGRSNSSSAGSS